MNAPRQLLWTLTLACLLCTIASAAQQPAACEKEARRILDAAGIEGGLIVHVGCGDGRLTAALSANDGCLVHGLDSDPALVTRAREHIRSHGLYGPICVDTLAGRRLPYVDNLVNLVVSEDLGRLGMEEVMRVLCPGGVACIKQDGKWRRTVKPRPDALDDWTHYLHDASNNAVSHDSVVGPPDRMQWIGSPRYGRHHDRMSSVSAAVSAGGRVFYIIDEASPASILIPPKWTLVARDAFNGTVLWKRPLANWHTHLWPLKSGPAQLPRRLVAAGDRVYATLGFDAPLTALDASTGTTLHTYDQTRATEEIVYDDGVLYLLVNPNLDAPEFAGLDRIKHAYGGGFWDGKPRNIVAVEAATGEKLWAAEHTVLPVTLATAGRRVFFHDGRKVVCLDGGTGAPAWHSDPIDRSQVIKSFYSPTLVVHDDVVLFSGGETAGQQTGSWYRTGKDTLTAVSAATGKVLWTAPHPPSGYRSPEDVLVANNLVWTGETTSGRAAGAFTGRDLRTGRVVQEFAPELDTYWFHHRCYRGKATDNYLLMSRTGVEFIDVKTEQWTPHHWVRGACLYGIMPANGLMYSPPHPCACYLEAKMYGFNALAPRRVGPRVVKPIGDDDRLTKGPAYGTRINAAGSDDDWPTYRCDAGRSGTTKMTLSEKLRPGWHTGIGGKLTAPVIAGGRIYVASKDQHALYALDGDSGKQLWRFTAGGRIDSPPTVYEGRVLFGCADGRVYCLRASDGAAVWTFLAAPTDQRLMAFEQIESVWPVHGSVLVQDDVLYFAAGRSMFLDGGVLLWRLDPKTGRVLSKTAMDSTEASTGKDLQDYITWLNMPAALPDILSSDGRLVYMRSQPFQLDGTRLPLEKMPQGQDADRGAPAATQRADRAHLFSPTGFLDDTYWHRTYWMYGSRFVSGWCGYYLAGRSAPAGRILVFDDLTVYGFGRKPQYYRWTTPIEHQLFAAPKSNAGEATGARGNAPVTRIQVEKSSSLNPANQPLTVQAHIRANKPDGVIIARGGSSQGYALYIRKGRPRFALRINQQVYSVSARQSVTDQWVHIAGVLSRDKKIAVYVDGKLAGSRPVPSLMTADPAEAMQIGADEGSIVGEYTGEMPFAGLIDEVRIDHRALTAAQIENCASKPGGIPKSESIVLWYSFDDGKAADDSDNGNNGTVEGAAIVNGRTGRAMQFSGKSKQASDFDVEHRWTRDLPILARAMVLAGRTLFVAGVPDVIDEPEALRDIDDPATRPALVRQAAAIAGKTGGLLLAISPSDADETARYELDSPPVFDGMAAASGRLYMTTVDGDVLCFQSAQ